MLEKSTFSSQAFPANKKDAVNPTDFWTHLTFAKAEFPNGESVVNSAHSPLLSSLCRYLHKKLKMAPWFPQYGWFQVGHHQYDGARPSQIANHDPTSSLTGKWWRYSCLYHDRNANSGEDYSINLQILALMTMLGYASDGDFDVVHPYCGGDVYLA